MGRKPKMTLAIENYMRRKMRALGGDVGREWLRNKLLNDVKFTWKTDKDIARNVSLMVLVYPDVVGCKVIDWEPVGRYHKKIYVELTMLDGSKVESSFRNNGTFKWYLQGYGGRGEVYDLRNGDHLKWKTSKDWDTNFKAPLENAESEDGRKIVWHKFTNLGRGKEWQATATLNFKLEGDEEIYTIPTVYSHNLKQYKKGTRKIIQEGVSRGELIAYNVLRALGIETEKQAKFDGLVGVGNGALRMDFLFEYNGKLKVLEVDGEFHRKEISMNGRMDGKLQLANTQEHDRRKDAYCAENGIDMIRYPYDSTMSDEEIKIGIIQKLAQNGIY